MAYGVQNRGYVTSDTKNVRHFSLRKREKEAEKRTKERIILIINKVNMMILYINSVNMQIENR